jgi:excisionase family DNA binding protein
MNDTTDPASPPPVRLRQRRPRRAGIADTGGGDLLCVPDAAAYIGISVGTLRNWLSMSRLPYVKIGRLTKLSKRALDAFIAANTVDAVE